MVYYSTMNCVGSPLTKYTWKLHSANLDTAITGEVNALHCFQLRMPLQVNCIGSVHYNQIETIGKDLVWGLVYCTFRKWCYLHAIIAESEMKPQFQLYNRDLLLLLLASVELRFYNTKNISQIKFKFSKSTLTCYNFYYQLSQKELYQSDYWYTARWRSKGIAGINFLAPC